MAFELWCWRLLRDPWIAGRSNQTILKEINLEYSLEGLVMKLKLWEPNAKSLLIRKGPDAGKDQRKEEKGDEIAWDGWMALRLNGHEFEQALGVGEGQGTLACCSPWGHKEYDTEQLNTNTHVNPHMFKTKTYNCWVLSDSLWNQWSLSHCPWSLLFPTSSSPSRYPQGASLIIQGPEEQETKAIPSHVGTCPHLLSSP